MAHATLKPGLIRKVRPADCPPHNMRPSMLGMGRAMPLMLQLNDNVWRRAYVLDTGQSYVVVNGAEQLIGPKANARISKLLSKV